MKRIAIVGSRQFPAMEPVREFVRGLPIETVVVSGGARGVDTVAETAARLRGMPVQIFRVTPADWQAKGPRAGLERNKQIVAACDEVVAFWDGESRGTKFTIDYAKNCQLPVTVYVVGPLGEVGELELSERE